MKLETKREKIRGFFSGIKGRLFLVLVAFLIFVGGGTAYYLFSAAAATPTGAKVSIAKQGSTKYRYGANGNEAYTYKYSITYTSGAGSLNGKTRTAMCMEPKYKSPSGLTNQDVYDPALIDSTKALRVKKVLLTSSILSSSERVPYARWGSWARYANGSSTQAYWSLPHALIGWIVSGGTDLTGFGSSYNTAWQQTLNDIESVYSGNASYRAKLDKYELRMTQRKTSGNDTYQMLVWLEKVTTPEEPEEPEVPVTLKLGVKKESGDPSITEFNSGYSLAGAQFKICTTLNCSESGNQVKGTLTTGSNGKTTSSLTLDEGIYYVVETVAPPGFKLPDYSSYSEDDLIAIQQINLYDGMTGEEGIIEIEGGIVYSVQVDDPLVGRANILKKDLETSGDVALGAASLDGAVFQITNTDTLEVKTATVHNGAALFENLTPGSYVAEEVSAGTGYMSTTTRVKFTITSGQLTTVEPDDAIENRVKRGNVKWTKKGTDYNGTTNLANIPFVITSQTTGEKHVVVTDANGIIDTSAVSHTTNTNANDGMLNENAGFSVDSYIASHPGSGSGAGVWFSGTTSTTTTANNSYGALPYDTYEVTELKVAENDAFDTSVSFPFTISEDSTTANVENDVTNTLVDNPVMGTTATNSDGTGKEVEIGTSVTMKDTVSYSGLTAGASYKVCAVFKDTSGVVIRYNGNTIGNCTTFTAAAGGSGSVEIPVTFDSSAFVGDDIVVYETLTRGSYTLLVHPDGSSTQTEVTNQTFTIKEPEISSTTATADGGTVKEVNVGLVPIYDKVIIKGAINGDVYQLKTWVEDPDGNKLTIYEDASGMVSFGNEVNTSHRHTGTTATDVVINMTVGYVDTTGYQNKKLTVFQQLTNPDGSTDSHPARNNTSEVNAESVTVKTASISTTAYDGTGTNESDKEIKISETAVIRDKVTYSGLQTGTKYKLRGKVINVENNAELATVEKEVIGGDTWIMDLTVDTRSLAGKKIAVYEYLYDIDGDTLIAKHEDKTDGGGQVVTVDRISIRTVAGNADDMTSHEIGVGVATVSDVVYYDGLNAGETYTLSATLHRPDGTECASATKTFTAADGGSGSEIVTFYNVNTINLIGEKLSIIEKLYIGSGTGVAANLLVTHNADRTDEDETVTVRVPTLGTTAYDGTGTDQSDKEIKISEVATVKDKIAYSGFVSGAKYGLYGKLILVETGEVLAEASQEVVEGQDWIMNFTVDTLKYGGKRLVVYEYLYPSKAAADSHGNDWIIRHEDINDDGQIVHVVTPTLATKAENNKEGGENVGIGTAIEISDKVTYTGLNHGESYKLVSELVYYDGSEKRIVKTLEETFTASLNSGTGEKTVLFSGVSTVGLDGKTLIINQYVYPTTGDATKDAIPIVLHSGDDDDDEQIYVLTPIVSTSARDGTDGSTGAEDRTLGVGREARIIDTVSYSGLAKNEEYKIKGYLMAEDGMSLAELEAETFTATDESGTVQVVFDLDTSELFASVDKVVVVEELYKDDTLIAVHNILDGEEHTEDEILEQTILLSTPDITTVATAIDMVDELNGDKIVKRAKDAKILDTVSYSGLIKGNTYKVKGKLYFTDETEVLLGNDEIVAESGAFIAEDEEGEVEITFTLDTTASGLPGKTLVAFEDLYAVKADDMDDMNVIAQEKDATSTDQSVEVQPRVGTKVIDKIDEDQAVGVGRATIVDTVEYEGLKEGHTYRVYGYLVDKKSGKRLVTDGEKTIFETEDEASSDDQEAEGESGSSEDDGGDGQDEGDDSDFVEVIYGEATFTIGEDSLGTSGIIRVELSFDSTRLQGAELVVFEELWEVDEDDGDILRAEHKDLEDEAQMIDVKTALIGTTAKDADDGDKELEAGEGVSVLDVVEYRGLVKGDTYKLVGLLVDKGTGDGIGVQTELEFVAEGETGEVEIEFSINTTGMHGKELVAFERLYHIDQEDETEVEIATHEDINDEKQTVWVEIKTPNTGIFGLVSDKNVVLRMIIVEVIIGFGGIVCSFINRKRKIKF